jgi:diaminohydroxyphosphoribosylaminopyrimidine deaminase / 5-amino-6-(5-phosphoribosylamino)uracil reductase
MSNPFSRLDIYCMYRALVLALRGGAAVIPNPQVGAVIAKDGRILGQGYHKIAGGNHAEVEAIIDATKRYGIEKLRESTIYVTLEPCNHYGKTPPCTEAIIEVGIKRVVFACKDLNQEVKGGGEKFLRENGVAVESGLLRDKVASILTL